MSTPKRIQRKRTKGWRMPDGAVYVGRPTVWGSPYLVRQSPRFAGVPGCWYVEDRGKTWTPEIDSKRAAIELSVQVYRGNVLGFWNRNIREAVKHELGGKDLACWCPLDQPCHADVLLEIANRPALLPKPDDEQEAS
ncbi:MAG: DUF4326 domain-containing protein [Acidimicrobiia bacterium]